MSPKVKLVFSIINKQKLINFFFAIFLSLALYFSLTSLSFAQTNPTSNSNYPPLSSNYITQSSPNFATKAFYDFGHALSCILQGSSPLSPCLQYNFTKNLNGSTQATPYLSGVNTSGGLLGLGGSALVMLFENKPLDQMSFLAYLGQNIGIVDTAQAQVGGSGNQVLSPIFSLWLVSRNVAYLAMILVFIGIGVMVMFRQKLNPQTVITAQMALPGLVVGLILITFSYFLASLITDMAYVGTDLVGFYFNEAVKVTGGTIPTEPLTQRLANENPLTIGSKTTDILKQADLKYFVDQFYNNLPGGGEAQSATQYTLLNPSGIFKLFVAGMTYMLYNGFLSGVSNIAGGAFGLIGGAIGGKAGTVTSIVGTVTGGSGTVAAGLAGADAWARPTDWLSFWVTILAVLIMIYTMVRLVLRLLNSYLMIIFLTISSPFVFLASALPGRQGMATDWARNMLCNVLSFPAVIAVFYFAAFLIGNNEIPGFAVNQPFNLAGATGNLPLLGGFNLELLRKIIAFVAILATPSIPDIICRSVGKPGQAGGILAGAVSGAIAGGQRYQGQVSGQIQKAGSDVGSWKGSLFGKKQYTGGRAGAIQTKLAALADEPVQYYVGHPGFEDTSVAGQMRKWIEKARKADPITIPQSPHQVYSDGEALKTKKRSGYG